MNEPKRWPFALQAKCPNCALAQPKPDVEAIVRECAKVIEDHYEPVYDGEILLKHFGLAR